MESTSFRYGLHHSLVTAVAKVINANPPPFFFARPSVHFSVFISLKRFTPLSTPTFLMLFTWFPGNHLLLLCLFDDVVWYPVVQCGKLRCRRVCMQCSYLCKNNVFAHIGMKYICEEAQEHWLLWDRESQWLETKIRSVCIFWLFTMWRYYLFKINEVRSTPTSIIGSGWLGDCKSVVQLVVAESLGPLASAGLTRWLWISDPCTVALRFLGWTHFWQHCQLDG